MPARIWTKQIITIRLRATIWEQPSLCRRWRTSHVMDSSCWCCLISFLYMGVSVQSAGWHRPDTLWSAWASSWDTQRCSHRSYESVNKWVMGLVHEQGRWWNKSSSVPLVCLTTDLGVKRDAFIIESAPEEEVRESCEGVKSKDKSRYDEKGEAHRSLRRVFDSVLHSIPLLPVATARKMLVSTKIYSGLSYSNSRSVNMHTSNLNVFMSDTYPDQQ